MNYYSVRKGKRSNNIRELFNRITTIANSFRNKDYFKQKLKLYGPKFDFVVANQISYSELGVPIFPFKVWANSEITDDQIFDTIEFLHEHISKPGKLGYKTDHTGYNYEEYLSYSPIQGKKEFRNAINKVLVSYKEGYVLNEDGRILFLGGDSINLIKTDFPKFDKENVDNVIQYAYIKWKNKNQSIEEKREAIVQLARVLEFLKKEGTLERVLDKKDSRDLFNIANNFAIRHHNPDQKTNYDKEIWYDWIFQYFMITIITALRLINSKSSA